MYSSRAIDCYVYMNDPRGNACVVQPVCYKFSFVAAGSIQNF